MTILLNRINANVYCVITWYSLNRARSDANSVERDLVDQTTAVKASNRRAMAFNGAVIVEFFQGNLLLDFDGTTHTIVAVATAIADIGDTAVVSGRKEFIDVVLVILTAFENHPENVGMNARVSICITSPNKGDRKSAVGRVLDVVDIGKLGGMRRNDPVENLGSDIVHAGVILDFVQRQSTTFHVVAESKRGARGVQKQSHG